ncbi:MAG: hypothetical protein ACI85E_001044, partial [Marinomonas primoryensis]
WRHGEKRVNKSLAVSYQTGSLTDGLIVHVLFFILL